MLTISRLSTLVQSVLVPEGTLHVTPSLNPSPRGRDFSRPSASDSIGGIREYYQRLSFPTRTFTVSLYLRETGSSVPATVTRSGEERVAKEVLTK